MNTQKIFEKVVGGDGSRWGAGILAVSWLVLTSAVCFALYPQRFAQLHTHWVTAGDLDMGYLLLAAAIFLVLQRATVTKVQLNIPVLFAMLVLSVVIFFLNYLDIKSLFFLALALLYYLSIWLIFGWAGLRSLLLPISLVFMAFPFWYLAIGLLHSMTTIVNHQLVDWFAITAIIDGNYIRLPTGTVHIARGCSGFKYFLAAATLAVIASILRPSSSKEFAVNALVIVALAILANWVRVFILILVGYYIGMHHPLMADHDILGWVVFLAFLLPWFLLGHRMQRFFTAPRKLGSADHERQMDHANLNSRFVLSLMVGALMLAAILSFPRLVFSFTHSTADADSLELWIPTNSVAGYRRVPDAADHWFPDYQGYSNSFYAQLRRDVSVVDIVGLEYGTDAKTEMVTQDHKIFSSEDYDVLSNAVLEIGDGAKIRKIRQIVARKKNERAQRVAYSWFAHGDLRAVNSLGSKIASARSLLTGNASDRLVVVSVTCYKNCEAVLATKPELSDLLVDLYDRS